MCDSMCWTYDKHYANIAHLPVYIYIWYKLETYGGL